MDFFFKTAKDIFGIDDGPQFSKAEIARHHSKDSLWIISERKVYDATQFIDQHPGGYDALIRRGGGCQDCTRDFGFHSTSAQSLWKSFEIGEVVSTSGTATDDAGRTYLKARGFIPVEDLVASDVRSKCASPNRICGFHFRKSESTTNTNTAAASSTTSSSASTSAAAASSSSSSVPKSTTQILSSTTTTNSSNNNNTTNKRPNSSSNNSSNDGGDDLE